MQQIDRDILNNTDYLGYNQLMKRKPRRITKKNLFPMNDSIYFNIILKEMFGAFRPSEFSESTFIKDPTMRKRIRIRQKELNSIARVYMIDNGTDTAKKVTIAREKHRIFHKINKLERKWLSVFNNHSA